MSGRVHVVGYLSIDRIETPDAVAPEVPGGAALYAALAANALGASVTLHAVAGEDFRAEWLRQLAARGIDLAGVLFARGPTRRARLAYGSGDRRISAHHGETLWWDRTCDLAPVPPAEPASDDIVALMAVPAATARTAIAAARRSAARVAMDTSAAFAARERDAVLAHAAQAFAFAPSVEETRLLFADIDDDAAAIRLAATGCHVLHKRGAAGAFAVCSGGTQGRHFAAPAASVRDTTGAGDAVVGALAAGLAAGLDFNDAAPAALALGARCVSGLGPAALGLGFSGSASP